MHSSPQTAEIGTWVALLSGFDTYLRAAGRSPGTIRLYRYRLADLAARHPSPIRVTTAQLEHELGVEHWSPETRKSVRTAYRAFFSWAARNGHLPSDPAASLPTVRVPRAAPRPVPEAALLEALRLADDRGQLMLMLAAYCGLRAGEIAQVHGDDYDRWECVLRIEGKGRKVRLVPVVMPDLARRLAAIDGWAFPNGHGTHLSPGHVTRLVSRMLPGSWTAHPCRHRAASQAYAGTRDLLAVGEFLGHSRPETTQRYVRLPDGALRAAAQAAAA